MVHLGRNDYHEKDSEKEFCIATANSGSGFHRSYLIVLLQSDSLFNSGMTRIFHGQSKSYYDAILSLSGMGCAQDLKANRPAAEYKDLVKKVEAEAKKGASRQGKEKRMRDPSASDLHDPAEEAEVNFLCLPSKAEVAEAKQCQTVRTARKTLIAKKRTISISASDDSDIDEDDSALANAVAVPSQGAELRQRKKKFKAKTKQDQKDAHGSTAEGDAGSQPGLECRKKGTGIGSVEKEDEVAVKTEKEEVLKEKDCIQPFQYEVVSIVSSDEDAGSAKRAKQSKQSGHPQEAVGASSASASDPQGPEPEVPVPVRVLPPEEHPSQVSQELSSPSVPSSSSRAASSRDVPSERPVAVEAPVGDASSTSHGAAEVAKATRGSERASSALFNLSTVWLGEIPVVQRNDKGNDSWKTIHFVTVAIRQCSFSKFCVLSMHSYF